MTIRAYDVADEFLDQMMDLNQEEREKVLGLIERLFCHCGHLNSQKYISRLMVSHSQCDHVPAKPLEYFSSVTKPSQHEEDVSWLKRHTTLIRSRYSE